MHFCLKIRVTLTNRSPARPGRGRIRHWRCARASGAVPPAPADETAPSAGRVRPAPRPGPITRPVAGDRAAAPSPRPACAREGTRAAEALSPAGGPSRPSLRRRGRERRTGRRSDVAGGGGAEIDDDVAARRLPERGGQHREVPHHRVGVALELRLVGQVRRRHRVGGEEGRRAVQPVNADDPRCPADVRKQHHEEDGQERLARAPFKLQDEQDDRVGLLTTRAGVRHAQQASR